MIIENTNDLCLMGDEYTKSQLLFTALDINIFEKLNNNKLTIDELSSELNLNSNAMGRFVNWFTKLNLLEQNGNTFYNSDFTNKYLVRSSPDNYVEWIIGSKVFQETLWPKLNQALKTGYDQYGTENQEMWDKFYSNKEELLEVMSGFDSLSRTVGRNIIKQYKFKHNSTIVDIGGGSGGLASEIKKQHPSLNCGVADREDTIDLAKKHFPYNINHYGVDFLKQDLPKADYMILSWIIHDWDDVSIKKILSNCHKNLNEGGKIMLIELLPEEDNSFGYWDIMDGHMLLSTSGKERTLDEYKQLMKVNGFEYLDKFSLNNDFRKVMVYEKK
ncbi:methyltransferase domain-containing protein [Candidatus Woesearchaeota archaeon]|jgi:ubiquinone/menaquinone biosynthesis C-methylase UbiE/predicted transcriptional regulator|nr:methyltransferase domain-containing protein [Candidatus Woesearchaeota archaeon]MBT4387942.1 methyltransferase domain-containing protein [Candidatus Woesearchaeota archaeon]MBT4595760.1 methyltransferase domain-containing protein [Candidatus Woesearchaeota archaeon]MBT5741391.1 methyltransferase domain-containing protein [Candidatus Woesearchaeota archaeon]MBT6505213.1 methyltransferase domain-containing protein [Candidatus Woesearchaeota archaeon]